MDLTDIGKLADQYGIAFVLGILITGLFFAYLNIRRKEIEHDTARINATKEVDLKDSETQKALVEAVTSNAGAIVGLNNTLLSISQDSAKNTQVNAKSVEALGQILANQQNLPVSIQAVAADVNKHTDDIITPYQAIHRGHTEKLENIQDIQGQILVLVQTIQTGSEEQTESLKGMKIALAAWIEDTAPIPVTEPTNHKEIQQ